jgi:hypothetical protein
MKQNEHAILGRYNKRMTKSLNIKYVLRGMLYFKDGHISIIHSICSSTQYDFHILLM